MASTLGRVVNCEGAEQQRARKKVMDAAVVTLKLTTINVQRLQADSPTPKAEPI